MMTLKICVIRLRRFHTMSRRGVTLAELLIAGVVAFVVILGITQVDMTRIHIMSQLQATTTLSEAAKAMYHMVKQLMQADRIIVLSADNAQFRIPKDRTALDDPAAGYRWAQYKLVDGDLDGQPDTINFYDDTAAGCGVDAVFGGFSSTSSVLLSMGLGVTYHDEDTPPPPGGDPPMNDNNVVRITVTRTSTQITPPLAPVTETDTGGVTLRAGAYTDLQAGVGTGGPGDSGTGLLTPEPPGGAPPPSC